MHFGVNSYSKISFIVLNLCKADSKGLRAIKFMNQGHSRLYTRDNTGIQRLLRRIGLFKKICLEPAPERHQ